MKRTIGNSMTAHPHTIGADETLEKAKKVMYSLGIRHLPVLEGGKLIGIVSDRDIKLAYAVDILSAAKCTVGDSCTTDVFSADSHEDLKSVTATMAEKGIGCCVITENGKVAGIFTTVDACKVLTELLSAS